MNRHPDPRSRAAAVALCVSLAIAALAGDPRGGQARVRPDLPAEPAAGDTSATAGTGGGRIGGGGYAPTAVPDIVGPGHVTTTSRLWLKTTNIGVMGNPFTAESDDPAAQWPGPSGVEYLYYWSLWVGAAIPDAPTPEQRYRVSAATEWRPPTLDPVDHIYETSAWSTRARSCGSTRTATARTTRSSRTARTTTATASSTRTTRASPTADFTLEMRDDTPQATNTPAAEKHVPLGLRVRQSVYSFQADPANNLVGVRYEITNVSGRGLDSVYVGFFVDQDCGPSVKNGYWRDDLPEPRVPSAVYEEIVLPTDPRYDSHGDLTHGTFCTTTSYRVCGFSMTDDDGDGGQTPGASTFMLLDHSMDQRGIDAPHKLGFRAFHLYRPGTPFSSGGTPTVDFERYLALSEPFGVSDGLPALDRPLDVDHDDWSSLCSVGPYRHLDPGQTVFVTVALGVWPVDFTQPASVPGHPDEPNPARYQKVIDGARDAQLFYRGQFRVPPKGMPAPQAEGRETYVVAPPDQDLLVEDCHFNADSTGGELFHLPAGTGYWFNFNCDYCDAVKGRLLRHWSVPVSPPAPGVRLTPGDHAVRLDWDNASETVPDYGDSVLDPNKGTFKFWGYRLYRAAGYTRQGGVTGPSDAQWELVANLRRFDALEPLIDSVDTNGDGRPDARRATPDVLLDLASGQRYPATDLPVERDPATGDTLWSIGIRPYVDPGCNCVKTRAPYKVAHWPIGRYTFRDPDVLNGFPYFYCITAVDSSGLKGLFDTPGNFEMREGARYAVEGQIVTPHAATAAPGQRKVIVVPNPYRGRAAWDLSPSPADPTGAHVDFMHMPPGAWTLRIFTLAGDLVQTIRNTDLTVQGRPQQEDPTDGEASWNLVSRNGQDVASGIYLFSVESRSGTERGKFVIIR